MAAARATLDAEAMAGRATLDTMAAKATLDAEVVTATATLDTMAMTKATLNGEAVAVRPLSCTAMAIATGTVAKFGGGVRLSIPMIRAFAGCVSAPTARANRSIFATMNIEPRALTIRRAFTPLRA
jgi:hypothetical protein